jgi:hypothetical protein
VKKKFFVFLILSVFVMLTACINVSKEVTKGNNGDEKEQEQKQQPDKNESEEQEGLEEKEDPEEKEEPLPTATELMAIHEGFFTALLKFGQKKGWNEKQTWDVKLSFEDYKQIQKIALNYYTKSYVSKTISQYDETYLKVLLGATCSCDAFQEPNILKREPVTVAQENNKIIVAVVNLPYFEADIYGFHPASTTHYTFIKKGGKWVLNARENFSGVEEVVNLTFAEARHFLASIYGWPTPSEEEKEATTDNGKVYIINIDGYEIQVSMDGGNVYDSEGRSGEDLLYHYTINVFNVY